MLLVCLSMYGPLLPPDIKGLITKEIRILLFDQNCQSQVNSIFYYFRIPPRLVYAYL